MLRTIFAIGVLTTSALACIGGSSGGGCCPPSAVATSSCAPSAPPCSSSSYGAPPPPPPPPPVAGLGGGSYAQAPAFGGAGPVGGFGGGPIGGIGGGPIGGAGGYASAPSAPVFGGASAGGSYAAPVSSYGAQASQGASYAQGPAGAVGGFGGAQGAGGNYAQGPAAAVGNFGGAQGGASYAQGPAAVGGFSGAQASQGGSYAAAVSAPASNFEAAQGGYASSGAQEVNMVGAYVAPVTVSSHHIDDAFEVAKYINALPRLGVASKKIDHGSYAAGPSAAVGAGGAYAAPVAAPQTVVTEVQTVQTGPAIVQPQIVIDQPAPQLPAYTDKAAAQQNVQTITTETQQATLAETQYEDDSAEQAVAPAQPAPTAEYKEQPAPVVEEPAPAVEPVQQVTTVEEVHEEPAPVVVEAATAAPSHASAAEESSYDDVESEASIPAGPATPSGTKKTTEAEYTDYQADEEQATDEGNCDDAELRAIVEASLAGEKDNLEAARKIEGDASAKFGGRFNSIVSDAEFAYVNWYGKRNCQLRIENRHSLTWED